jgi:cell division protein FtsI (penicillin-binding protein 3)
VTPLQLANAYTAIANDGRLRAPTYVKGAQNPDTAVIDPQIAASLRAMLETVVSPEGSGLKASITNYRVAGKTGTSRAASGGGYDNRHISLFVGMVPASKPRLVGVVVIHDPEGAYYGGLVSAPVFSKVMDGALRLLDVPPDNVKNWYTGSPQGAPTMDSKVPPASDDATELSNYAEGVP